MPRLTKAQREARDERKTAVAAQLAADAQTADLPPGSIDAPPPPSASALSTNQPQAAAVVASEAFAAGSNSIDRSSSAVSDTPARAESLGGQSPSITAAALARKSRSRSPLGAASEMSTSEGSGNEDDGKDKSMTVDGAVDELDGDDDDEMAGASNGNNPEVKCMWEDCGQVFTSLAPFIAHLHEGESSCPSCRGNNLTSFSLSFSCRPRRYTQSSLCLRVDRVSSKGKDADESFCPPQSLEKSYG
jgi:hypothetical protein